MGELAPGTVFGEFRIEALVGRGGMGLVYRARQERLNRLVALKVIAPHLALDEGFQERFRREAQMAAAIDHPNIIPIYDAGEVDGQPFLAMRYLDGTDLRAVLDTQAPLDPHRVVNIGEQVAAALDVAHARGLVHRDVKPANILIGREHSGRESVYLTDFGLTRGETDTRLTKTGNWVGTVDYMAPEQFSGALSDERVDQYSLACVMYEALTGRRPFNRDGDLQVMFAHVNDPPPTVSAERPELPPELDEALQRGMAKSVNDRFSSCSELMSALRSAVAAGGVPTVPATFVGASPTEPGVAPTVAAQTTGSGAIQGRKRVALLGGGVVAIGVGIATALLASGGGGGNGTTSVASVPTGTTGTTTESPTGTTTGATTTADPNAFPPSTAQGVLNLATKRAAGKVVYQSSVPNLSGKLRIVFDESGRYEMLFRTKTQEIRVSARATALQWACLREGTRPTVCIKASTMDAKTRAGLEKSLTAFRNVFSNEGITRLFTPIVLLGPKVYEDRQAERRVACMERTEGNNRVRLCTTRTGLVTEINAIDDGTPFLLRATSLQDGVTEADFAPPARLR